MNFANSMRFDPKNADIRHKRANTDEGAKIKFVFALNLKVVKFTYEKMSELSGILFAFYFN